MRCVLAMTLLLAVPATEQSSENLVIYLCHYDTGTTWWDDASVTVERADPTWTIARRKASATLPLLSTEDGLAIELSNTGGVAAVYLDGKPLPATAPRSGLWLHPVSDDGVPNYELYPWAFEKRVRREGLWLFGPVPAWLPDPENYAFHEGGPAGWEYNESRKGVGWQRTRRGARPWSSKSS